MPQAAAGQAAEGQAAQPAKPQQLRGRQAWRVAGNAGSRQGSVDRTQQRGREATKEEPNRGKKRRPTSQEPRAVSAAAPAPRKVQAFPQVEAFLEETNCRCQKFALQATYRCIQYGQQKKPADAKVPDASAPMADAAPVATPAKAKVSPWEEYFRANNHFVKRGQFMHTIAFKTADVDGRRLLAVVPHPKRVNME